MRWCVSLAVLLVCVACVAAQAAEQQTDDRPVLPTIKTIDGKVLDADAMHGKVVVVEFWATWCTTCAAELPHLKKLYKRYHDDDVLFVGMTEQTDRDVVAKYVKQHDIPWHIALDEDHALAKQFKINALPRALVIARDGSIAWQGMPNDMDKTLRKAVHKD